MSRAYAALLDGEGVATRATFIVDPAGVIQYAAFHNLEVGRSPSEICVSSRRSARTSGCPRSGGAAIPPRTLTGRPGLMTQT